MLTTTAPRTEEAVAVAHAMVAEVCSSRGARALAMTGTRVAWQPPLGPGGAAPVQVLVEPGRLREVLSELTRLGWHERAVHLLPATMPWQTSTLVHPAWACDLQVHAYVPGFFADPGEAFERMWSTRARADIAGILVDVPSWPVSVCMRALHALRSPGPDRGRLELPGPGSRSTDATDGVRAIDEVSGLLRARTALRPFLAAVGIEPGAHDLDERERRDWARHLVRHDPASAPAVRHLVRLRERPGLLWTALTHVDETSPGAGTAGSLARARHRAGRLTRTLRATTGRRGA